MRNIIRQILFVVLGAVLVSRGIAAEVMPPSPKQYFNDYAQVVSTTVAGQLNQKLENFEKETSSQIVVAIFQKLETDSSLDDYCYRIFQNWKVGQKGKNNGAVLFVFVQDRKMRIQTGYGLEGALPDALCKQIIDNELKPHFRNRDFDGGLSAGVNSMIKATRGEYKGTGRTVAAQSRGNSNSFDAILPIILPFGFFGLVILVLLMASNRRGRWIGNNSGGWISSGSSWSGGGGGFSGGGFSGGGGSSGGGGASGSW